MKWLHLTSGNLYGGIEAFLTTQARHQGQCPGYEVDYGLCFKGRNFDELRAAGARVHHLGSVRFSRPWTIYQARKRLTICLRENNYCGVVSHGPWVHGLFGPVVRGAALPLVFYSHGIYSGKHWTELLASRTIPQAVIFNSLFSAETNHRFWRNSRDTVIHVPVGFVEQQSTTEKSTLRASLQTSDSALVVIQVARMEAGKGHAATIRAFASSAPSSAVLWIIGGAQRLDETQYLQHLKALANDLRIDDRVRFLGERSDVPQLLCAADIYCQANKQAEPFGISLVEALYARLPVIAYNTGGAAEIVTSDCGILVPEHDEIALGLAMRSLLRDDAMRERLSSASISRARDLCDPPQQLQRQKNFLESILSP